MAIDRTASARWTGDLRKGSGIVSTESGALQEQPYSFRTRFENEPGTNPEELLAASHAGCFTMAFSGVLQSAGHTPKVLATEATCHMDQVDGGFKVTEMHLKVRGSAEGLDQQQFQQLAEQAEQGCPISNVLRGNVKVSVEATYEP